MTRIKILLVDDEKIFREEFEHIFLDSKYLLDTAVNSIEGRNKILNSHFDLIILDIRMPDFDNRFSEKGGIELLKWIRKNKQELLVIMLSVLRDVDIVVETMQIGAKNYIVKDKFTTTELFDKIDKALKEATFTLIKNGETEKVEFKSTLRYDFVHHGANKELSKVMARSISGFLNSDGGNLFIGIADNGEPIGIENDIKVLTKQNDDGFLSTLYQIVIDYIGTDFCHKVHPNILELENKKICSIKIDPSDKPAWFHDGRSEELFIRAGQSTRALDAKEAVEYVFERFKKNDF